MRIRLAAFFVAILLSSSVWALDYELGYDDGSWESTIILNGAGDAAAVRFTPLLYPTQVVAARFFIVWNTFLSPYYIACVLDDNGAGDSPGDTLLGPVEFYHPATSGWVEYSFPETLNIDHGNFYIAYLQGGTRKIPLDDLGSTKTTYGAKQRDNWTLIS